MRFEVSDRIITTRSQDELLAVLETQFKKVSGNVQRSGPAITVRLIEASFGSINRSDITIVSLKKIDGGLMIVGDIDYNPSLIFWLLLIATLFSGIFWIIPVGFYLLQKNTVQNAVKACFDRVKNEFDQSREATTQSNISAIEEIEKLAALKEKGFVTDSEFEAKKKQLLEL
jgi:hypothetical protein